MSKQIVEFSGLDHAASAVPKETPTRHGADLPASRAMAAQLRLLIKANPEPSEQDWAVLGQALWRGDPQADHVARWMAAEGMGSSWPLVEAALDKGLDAIPAGASALRDFIQLAETLPPWLDQAKLARGARVMQSTGQHGMMVLRDAGLMAGYQASAINQTLVMTGALQSGAQRRLAETTTWWLACTKKGGMARDGVGFKTTLRVRLIHAMVRAQVGKLPSWDAGALGVPINQVDMQATYLAFSVVQLLGLRMTGVLISAKESDAVMHLWRYIGWLMGVEADMLCDDEQAGRVLLYRNLISQAPSDGSSVLLARALMDEPLLRQYPWGGRWRGRFNRARHLSLVRWFVGSSGMKNLGLPPTWPWYPLLIVGPMVLRSTLLRVLPVLRPLWRWWARRQQTRYLGAIKEARL
ncbi:MAG: oxygenase MpaB family protein [Aquabacterium sp.]|nr:oxygenase MpaB family protein [Aquabacterium sp.]